MIFSKEQEDIFEYAQKGPFNMVIQAVAGAGKTTTLIECANRIDSDKRILMLAHNRSTRDIVLTSHEGKFIVSAGAESSWF